MRVVSGFLASARQLFDVSLDKRRENYARGTNLSLSLECRDSDAAVANANIEYVLVKE
ncbi:hypothetical protein MUK42_01787 [Musa troglodytarum]|uniref:Uncharacterized protein n=1 Tax=Musa troglodytarum TaxID=320322 RepID=A0A9E7ELM1_9LILI|nr:hypothetical protein MUK42_01787 [Musa troglodytarum]